MRNLSILHPYEGGVSNNSLLALAPLYPRYVGHVILISHVVFAVCALSVGSVSSCECLDAPAILATFTAGRTGLVACP